MVNWKSILNYSRVNVEVFGHDTNARSTLQKALKAPQPIHWISSGDGPDWVDDQLQPLNQFLLSEEPSPLVTVVIPTHRQYPIGVAAFSRQARNISVLCNGGFYQRSPLADSISVVWRGHGLTRQAIVDTISTPYVFFSVDDAIPMGGMLHSLIETLEKHGFDAIIPRQIPWPAAAEISRRALHRWTPKKDQPYQVPQTDHVGTLYRRETLIEQPIPDVPIAEDAWWSIDKNVGCDPNAVILHSHRRRTLEIFQRELTIHQQLRQIGRPRPFERYIDLLGGGLGVGIKYGCREWIRTSASHAAQILAWKGTR